MNASPLPAPPGRSALRRCARPTPAHRHCRRRCACLAPYCCRARRPWPGPSRGPRRCAGATPRRRQNASPPRPARQRQAARRSPAKGPSPRTAMPYSHPLPRDCQLAVRAAERPQRASRVKNARHYVPSSSPSPNSSARPRDQAEKRFASRHPAAPRHPGEARPWRPAASTILDATQRRPRPPQAGGHCQQTRARRRGQRESSANSARRPAATSGSPTPASAGPSHLTSRLGQLLPRCETPPWRQHQHEAQPASWLPSRRSLPNPRGPAA
mmetsp:Transcript_133239/g.385607  ORF Transcript_133239/g.385607 Transcript_133239/m.385607 type:complete len:270 (+) Transcript_133239:1184-1993(+)